MFVLIKYYSLDVIIIHYRFDNVILSMVKSVCNICMYDDYVILSIADGDISWIVYVL